MTRSRRLLLPCGTKLAPVLALIAVLAVPANADARDGGGGGGSGGGGAGGGGGGHAGSMGSGMRGGHDDVHISAGAGGGHRAGGMPNGGGGRVFGGAPGAQGATGRPFGGYASGGPVAIQNQNAFYGDRPSRDNEGPYFPEDEPRYAPYCYRFGGPHCPSGSHLRYGGY